MQAEESIEIKHIFARNIDAGPHGVILRLRMRHHNVQSVSRAALEDDDQAFVARARLRHAPCGTSKKARHRRRTDDGEGAVAQKDATSKCHKISRGDVACYVLPKAKKDVASYVSTLALSPLKLRRTGLRRDRVVCLLRNAADQYARFECGKCHTRIRRRGIASSQLSRVQFHASDLATG